MRGRDAHGLRCRLPAASARRVAASLLYSLTIKCLMAQGVCAMTIVYFTNAACCITFARIAIILFET